MTDHCGVLGPITQRMFKELSNVTTTKCLQVLRTYMNQLFQRYSSQIKALLILANIHEL